MTLEASRPVALAARLAGEPTAALEHLFARRTVLIRLAPEVATSVPMREAALLAFNAIRRFCPNVTLTLPSAAMEVADSARELARAIHGDEAVLPTCAIDQADVEPFDAVLGVGRELRAHHAWIAVDASGWCARVATSASGAHPLPPAHVPANELTALAAACLGAGPVFLALAGRPLLANPLALSLFDLTTGAPGELDVGPPLPSSIELNALLIGCGGVTNGFAYASARTDLTGRIEAVDKQSLRRENMGPYVCATQARLGMPKAEVIRDVLAPNIDVIPRNERFRFFLARIGYGQTSVPPIVIAGLDDERVRHDVQRLWAPLTVDLAAEELTAQVIVKGLEDDGICLLGACRLDADAPDEFDELAAALGLSRERGADFESEITADDVASAPLEKRAALEQARRRGQRVCGRATGLDLNEEEPGTAFTPAVPFVTAFSGIVGAAQTIRELLGAGEGSLHFQLPLVPRAHDADAVCFRLRMPNPPRSRGGLTIFRHLAASKPGQAGLLSIERRFRPEGSIKGAIPAPRSGIRKSIRKERPRVRGFCRAL
jgi:hypothetical protein